MGYDFWQEDSELYKAVRAERPGIIDDGPSSSQPQQNYLLMAPRNHPPVVTQHHPMYGGDSTSNNERDIHISTGQPSHNASFTHFHFASNNNLSANNLESSGNVSESCSIKGLPHVVHDDQSKSHASNCSVTCKWNDGHGPCDKKANQGDIVHHVSSSHLLPGSSCTAMRCRWEGCKLQKPIRRDTIIRHIRQIHLGIRPRRQ